MIARGRRGRRPGDRRGGVLFEVMLSVALFAGAAAFALTAVRNVFTRLDLVRREKLALDLARGKLAELEAGLTNLAELREGEITRIGSLELVDDAALDRPGATIWAVDVHTEPTEFRGLVLVELTVREEALDGLAGIADDAGGFAAEEGDPAVSVTLRQLVRLRGIDAEEFEMDELLEGLPGVGP